MKLVAKGNEIFIQFLARFLPEHLDEAQVKEAKKVKGYSVHQEYQKWYSECIPLIRSILPDRIDEFIELYKTNMKRKDITWRNYTIEDYILGLVVRQYGEKLFEPESAFVQKFQSQIMILESAGSILDSALRDIESVLQAQLFDNELEASEDLHKKGHRRAAGAVAGVVVEGHLVNICATHGIKFRKKSPTIRACGHIIDQRGFPCGAKCDSRLKNGGQPWIEIF